jgi:SAM-dependent methyltransferase
MSVTTITAPRTDATPGQLAGDGLALYDLTRQRLYAALASQLPAAADFEGTLTAYAYWVCSVVGKRGADWETTLQEYVGYALRDAARETEAEQAEFATLRRALGRVAGDSLLLDVGAGWGRLARLYEEAALTPVYVEPTDLGVRLMQRDGLRQVAAARGEALPFAAGAFTAVLIGWVLHHHSAESDAPRILAEAARVLAPSGWLFSIEPIRPGFDMARWREILDQAGIRAGDTHEFYRMPTGQEGFEQYTLMIGQKPRGRL